MMHCVRNVPKVSVGLPVYNGEKYLRDALISLLNQTFSDFELIICDNASDDATHDICTYFESRFEGRMRYIRHQSNLGIMANFRHAFEAARGDYFMWAACDDLWDDSWIQNLVSLLDSSDIDFSFGRVLHIDESGELIEHQANDESYSYRGPAAIRQLMFYIDYEGRGKVNVIYGLFKRSLFPQISHALSDLESGQMRYDFCFVYRLLEAGSLGSDSSVAMKKRIRHDSSGEEMGRRVVAESFVARFVRRIFNPFPEGLLVEYFRFSSKTGRLLLLVFLPIKFFYAYWAQAISLLLYSRR